ncbi:MAG TPA: ATP-dependent RNA helicase RhlB [Deltaproteobacteria bacterium]|nr:ATP-dependent RNA helicase RhlB [Deltaproteobacteria bacterium]
MRKFFQKAAQIINAIVGTEKQQSETPNPGRQNEKDKASNTAEAPISERPSSDSQKRSKPKRPPRRRGRKWTVSQYEVPVVEGKTRFHDLNLPAPVLHAVSDLGFTYCTPIQTDILPSTLSGKDASGRAQTGTGKTAAFLITVITRMLNNPIEGKRQPGTPRVLILAPTRELVLQIAEEAILLSKYCSQRVVSVFGGMDYKKQQKQLAAGPVDIIVATPGRLLDFQQKREISLKKVEMLIIDEADRMLDMGFIPDVRKIIYSTPGKDNRQTLLFSATLTEEITRLASQWTRDPISVEIEPEQVAVDTVDQIVYIVTAKEKFTLLFNLIETQKLNRVLVFCNRRDEVFRLANKLTRYGIDCAELSGEIPQKKRMRCLDDFKAGKIRVLVATDVAGRGIHIEAMDHVFNFSFPRDPESYVHRIGRTGRAGASGTSISFADEDDSFYIPAVEEFIDRKLSCIEPEKEWLTPPAPVPEIERRKPRSRNLDSPARGKARRGSRPRRQKRPAGGSGGRR